MPNEPRKEPFEGNAAQMRESPWIASEDVESLGGTADVTISQVYRYDEVEFEAGRKKENVYAIAFKETRRQLVLNGANRKTLVSAFGQATTGWIGKSVTLYVVDNIKVGREMKKGVRIRVPRAGPVQ